MALAGYLSAMAFIEIRYLAGRAMRDEVSSAEALARIRLLADLCHNMPFNRRPWRGRRRLTSVERAMRARRMSWVWNTANPEKRAWILDHIEKPASGGLLLHRCLLHSRRHGLPKAEAARRRGHESARSQPLRVLVSPPMDTHIQIGPTGRKLLPLTVVDASAGGAVGG